jgi:hypothetical protein
VPWGNLQDEAKEKEVRLREVKEAGRCLPIILNDAVATDSSYEREDQKTF